MVGGGVRHYGSFSSCRPLVLSWLNKNSKNNNNSPPVVVRRWKHNKKAKMGQHLQKLDEMAHTSVHEAAQERRQKKKLRNEVRKGKKGGAAAASEDGGDDKEGEPSHRTGNDDDDDDDEEEEEEEMDEEEMDETVLPDPKEIEQNMKKHVIRFKEYLNGVRGGEPTPELFDDISIVDAYGKGTGVTPLKAVAQVVMQSPTLAVANCFDPATAKAVANAIREKLELTNPQVEEGGVIRIPLPRVSLESRQNTVRTVQERAEQFRKRIHQARSKAMSVVKQGVAGTLDHVSKDDAFRIQEAIEKAKDDALKEINALSDKKTGDILKL